MDVKLKALIKLKDIKIKVKLEALLDIVAFSNS